MTQTKNLLVMATPPHCPWNISCFFKKISAYSPVRHFFLFPTWHKSAKITDNRAETQGNRWVLFHPLMWTSSCVDFTLWASLQVAGFHCVSFSPGWVEPAASPAHTENGLFCTLSHVTRPFCCGYSYSQSLNHINENHLCWGQTVAFHRSPPGSSGRAVEVVWSRPTLSCSLPLVPAPCSCLFCGCCLFKKVIKPQRFIGLLI